MGRDPKKEKGGLNLYGFVANNPINAWDYLGMTAMSGIIANIQAEIDTYETELNQLYTEDQNQGYQPGTGTNRYRENQILEQLERLYAQLGRLTQGADGNLGNPAEPQGDMGATFVAVTGKVTVSPRLPPPPFEFIAGGVVDGGVMDGSLNLYMGIRYTGGGDMVVQMTVTVAIAGQNPMTYSMFTVVGPSTPPSGQFPSTSGVDYPQLTPLNGNLPDIDRGTTSGSITISLSYAPLGNGLRPTGDLDAATRGFFRNELQHNSGYSIAPIDFTPVGSTTTTITWNASNGGGLVVGSNIPPGAQRLNRPIPQGAIIVPPTPAG